MAVFIVIGKILLTILLIIICLILMILFDPIRYEADVGIDQKSAAVRVQWLFGLIRFRFRYRDGPQAEIRLLWKRIDLLNPDPKQEKKKRKFFSGRKLPGKKKKTDPVPETELPGRGENLSGAAGAQTGSEFSPERAGAEEKTGKKAAGAGDGTGEEIAAETKSRESAAGKDTGPDTGKENAGAETKAGKTAGKNESAAEKDIGPDAGIGNAGAETKAAGAPGTSKSTPGKETGGTSKKRKVPFVGRTQKKVGTGGSNTAQKVKSVVGKGKTILGMVSDYHVLDSVWPRLKRLFSHILPRRISGSISFGLSDPGMTGTITGMIAIIPLFYETELEIHPDFETDENTIHGHFEAAGHIQLIWAAVLIVGLLLDKQFRQFIRKLRKECR